MAERSMVVDRRWENVRIRRENISMLDINVISSKVRDQVRMTEVGV